MKTILKKFALLSIIFSSFSFTSCGKLPEGEQQEFTFNVESIGGLMLDDVELKIYYGKKLVDTVYTNDLGVATASLVDENYTIKIRSLPDGYYTNKNYDVYKGTYEYTFEVLSKVIDKTMPDNNYYNIGEVMYDFTYTDCDGVKFNLINELKSHDAVVINFWFSTCQYCFDEFPALQDAYELYKDDISLIALSISDYNNVVSSIKYDFGFTFNMAFDSLSLHPVFGFDACPATVIIDRYGIVSFMHDSALTEVSDWTELFDLFIGDDYYPISNTDGSDDRIPTAVMPDSKDIENIINEDGLDIQYSMDENESEYAFKWPWVISDDCASIQPSNSKIGLTAATIVTNVYLEAGQTLAFDYLSSTEEFYDILYVIVDGIITYEISGVDDEWKTCYVFVAIESRNHKISLTYFKDDFNNDGDDTVYIKNMRIIDGDDISTPTYFFRHASYGALNSETGNWSNYVQTFFNEEDGYYHVDGINGPLLQADLIYSTHWTNDTSLSNLAQNGMCKIGLRDYNGLIIEYANYANNSDSGYVPVTKELANAIKEITNYYSQNDNENEWLEVCCYFDAYGTNGEEMPDPIKGLAIFSAYEATLGDQNFATFNQPIVPRGKKFAFTPTESGVYLINSIGTKDTICWIFDENGNILEESNFEAHEFVSGLKESINFELYYYMEKDVTYYITPAFNDVGDVGTLQMSISYIGDTYTYLTACAPGYFTTGIDKDGNMTDEYLALNIDVTLGDDGLYHAVNDDGSLGSIVYADFYYNNQILTDTIWNSISKGAFNFKFDENGEAIQGEDLTTKALQIASNMIKDQNSELYGMVPVTEEVADLLQKLMDKYTFVQLDGSPIEYNWTKLCYYYKTIG